MIVAERVGASGLTLTSALRAGANALEIRVHNTLAATWEIDGLQRADRVQFRAP